MTVVATTASVDATRALAGAVSSLARPGDVIVLAGDLGAGKTAFVQGFGRGLGVTDRITSPTFTLVHVYEGRLPVHHLDVYRLEQMNEALDLGLPEMLDEGGVVLIEWGDAILPMLPHDFLEVRLTFGIGRRRPPRGVPCRRRAWAIRTERWPACSRPGRRPDASAASSGRRRDRQGARRGWVRGAAREALMLILGITTSTAQVGCAIGGHEGVLGAIQSTRGRRHAETLTPAIEFLCRQTRVELGDIGAIAVDLGPGLFTGLRVGVAAAKALSHARRLPMIGVTSLDLLAFPLRHSHRRIVCALDAGRGEIFHASYRQSPGGVQRVSPPEVASPADLASDLLALGEEVLLAGDGALRYQSVFEPVRRVEMADHSEAYPLAGSLVQLAHARALREEFVGPVELTPTYLRKPDAEINWSTRDGARS